MKCANCGLLEIKPQHAGLTTLAPYRRALSLAASVPVMTVETGGQSRASFVLFHTVDAAKRKNLSYTCTL